MLHALIPRSPQSRLQCVRVCFGWRVVSFHVGVPTHTDGGTRCRRLSQQCPNNNDMGVIARIRMRSTSEICATTNITLTRKAGQCALNRTLERQGRQLVQASMCHQNGMCSCIQLAKDIGGFMLSAIQSSGCFKSRKLVGSFW